MVIKAIISGYKHLFKSRMTIKYPDQRLKLPERYMGRHILDIPTCIHCSACFRACPTNAITMVQLIKSLQEEETPEKTQEEETPEKTQEEETPEKTQEEETPEKKKRKEIYPQISYELCVFCGLCVDVCPPKCLIMSHSFELSDYVRENLIYTPEKLSEVPSEEEGRYTTVFTRRGVSYANK